MKKLGFLLIVICLTSFKAMGQLSAQTNEMHLNFTEGLPNTTNLPEIKWIYPSLEFTTSQESRVEIKAEANSYYPLKEVKIIVGDKTNGIVYATKVLNIENNGKDCLIKEYVNLPYGSNSLEIIATNIQGASVSSHRNIVMGTDAISDAILIDRKDYALIIATDKYDNFDDLVNPIDDGKSIAKELKEKYGFETEIVENPTVEEVWEKLREYSSRKFKPQDQLLIFFAGHGQFDETFGEGFVVAKNSVRKDPSRNSYISHNRLRGVVNNIPSEHIFLVMDVCYGGTFDPVVARTRGADDATKAEMIARKLSLKTRKYLTSGGKEYVSDGIAGKHSPFAAKLLESLNTNGGDDGILTISELLAEVEKLKLMPRFGSFGDEKKESDFIFIAKRK
jgi:hypothetical protein